MPKPAVKLKRPVSKRFRKDTVITVEVDGKRWVLPVLERAVVTWQTPVDNQTDSRVE